MKLICKKCGEVNSYLMLEKVRRYLEFNREDEPIGATEDVTIYAGTVKYCPLCMGVLKVKE